MDLRRRNMMAKKGGLPAGWISIQYIQSTGNSWFSVPTNYDWSKGLRTEIIRADYIRITRGGIRTLFGTMLMYAYGNGIATYNNNGLYAIRRYSYGNFKSYTTFTGSVEIDTNFQRNPNRIIAFSDGSVYNENANIPVQPSYGEPRYFGIFCRNNGEEIAASGTRLGVLYREMNGVPMFDFQPCRNPSTNEVAMCNMLTSKIHLSMADPFVAGPDL